MKTMRAVRCYGFGKQHRFESEIPVPEPGPGELLIKVDASGICAADRAMYYATGPWQLNFPFTPGHEFTGTVVELGDGAEQHHGVSKGDRCIAELNITYGNDFYRQQGLYHLSDSMDVIGATLDGAWADYLIYPKQAVVHKVPDNVSNQAACYTEPLANAIHGVQRANIQFDDVVIVAGAGPIGMGMLQAAKLKNPRTLILVNPGAPKRKTGLRLGADLAFHPDDPQLNEAINDLTGSRGVDCYLEASGDTRSFTKALELTRKRGTIVVFGVYKEPVAVDLNIFGEFKELNIHGGHLAPFTYGTALRLMSRNLIDGDACVTHQFSLEQFETAITHKPDDEELQIKVILNPDL